MKPNRFIIAQLAVLRAEVVQLLRLKSYRIGYAVYLQPLSLDAFLKPMF